MPHAIGIAHVSMHIKLASSMLVEGEVVRVKVEECNLKFVSEYMCFAHRRTFVGWCLYNQGAVPTRSSVHHHSDFPVRHHHYSSIITV